MTEEHNPFAAPISNLVEQTTPGETPSIQEALSRGYNFSIGQVLSEAWALTRGAKGYIIAGLVSYYMITAAITLLLKFVLPGSGFDPYHEPTGSEMAVDMLVSLIVTIIAYPMLAGILILGINRAAGRPLNFNETFNHFAKTVPLFILAFLTLLLTYLGLLLFILPGIYLGLAYMLAIPVMIEHNVSPWQAMEASRKGITQHWFKVFGLFLVLGLIIMVSAIPLGIGLIWTMPMAIITMGVLYRIIFGPRAAGQQTVQTPISQPHQINRQTDIIQ